MRLYETHLPVAVTERSAEFYCDALGLTLAYRDPTRDIAFLWVGQARNSMLGLWGPTAELGKQFHRSHFAIAVSLEDLIGSAARLNSAGITTTNFAGEKTEEPSVIGWMPSAQLYFSDPDGHSVELIALLDDPPQANFVGPLSAWRAAR
ncbi:MAG: VOC family protein [Chthoniobacterales bacterium]